MGQSASLFRIAEEDFFRLKKDCKQFDLHGSAKQQLTFLQDFDGLIYILTRETQQLESILLKEIFYPDTFFGKGYSYMPHFLEEVEYTTIEVGLMPVEAKATTEEMVYESKITLFGGPVYYLSPEKVSSINSLLQRFSEEDVDRHYDSKLMNELGIYPVAWHDSERRNQVFNKRQLKEDLVELKNFFLLANADQDYIIVGIG